MKKIISLLRYCLIPFIIIAVLLCFTNAIDNINSIGKQKEKEQLQRALTRAAVACYTTQGAYPEDVDYLIKTYGIRIDYEEFTIKYEFIASNLMPDITILDN